jgi:WD40-like Beta Propeller Repeat
MWMLGRTSSASGFGAETFDFVEGFHLSAAVQSGAQTGEKSSLVPLTQGAGTGNFWKVRAFGVEQREQLPFSGGWASFPAVSPNGNRVVYGLDLFDTNICRLWLSSPGEAVGPLARFIASTRSDLAPRHSPDGKGIAFESLRSGVYGIGYATRTAAPLRREEPLRNLKVSNAHRPPQARFVE